MNSRLQSRSVNYPQAAEKLPFAAISNDRPNGPRLLAGAVKQGRPAPRTGLGKPEN